MTTRMIALAAAAMAAVVGSVLVALASTPHSESTPPKGYDSPTTHGQNPGHLYVAVGAPHSGAVTSGGIFHDSCSDSVAPLDGNLDTYFGTGGDYALDIDGAENTDTYLYLDYGGYGDCDIYPYPTPCSAIDRDENMTIKARLQSADGSGNCQYQWYDVLASYRDVAGNVFTDKVVGRVKLLHQQQWAYTTVGTIIQANASKTISGGTGTLNYISGLRVASVAEGSSSCSTGPHVHVEVYSTHMWGGWRERHSSAGPDFFHLPFSHVHGCDHDGSLCGQAVATPAHSLSQGESIGFIGGHGMARWVFDW